MDALTFNLFFIFPVLNPNWDITTIRGSADDDSQKEGNSNGVKNNNGIEDIIENISMRTGAIGLLIFAATSCGRHYRANRHNFEVNQHRQACFQNMKAFHRSVTDEAVKDMLILEFARAATQGMPTGFIASRAEAKLDSSPQILSLTARKDATSSD